MAKLLSQATTTLKETLRPKSFTNDENKGDRLAQRAVDGDISAVVELRMGRAKGDEKSIEASRKCLEYTSPGMRKAALATLGELTNTGDKAVISDIVRCLADKQAGVRNAAVCALRKICQPGDPEIVRQVMGLLRGPASFLETALVALRVVSKVGDPAVVKAVLPLTLDRSPAVREAAVIVVGEVAEEGDTLATAAVMEAMEDPETEVRGCASVALGKLLEANNQPLCPKMKDLLKHYNGHVRTATVRALAAVAKRGGATALETLKKRAMKEADPMTRMVAMEALGSLMPKDGDEAVRSPNVSFEQDILELSFGEGTPASRAWGRRHRNGSSTPGRRHRNGSLTPSSQRSKSRAKSKPKEKRSRIRSKVRRARSFFRRATVGFRGRARSVSRRPASRGRK